ncbi:hypothetical protein [Enterococcus pingfangensis]
MKQDGYDNESELLLKVRANLFREWKQTADNPAVEQFLGSRTKAMQRQLKKEAVGGHLLIFQNKLVFQPHSFNVDTSLQEIVSQDIQVVKRVNTFGVIPNGLIVETAAQSFQFVVSKRKRVIELLNSVVSRTN